METIATTLQTIKQAVELLNQKDILTIERINVNNYFNFLKLRLLNGRPSAKLVFESYITNPEDLKNEGKFEVWIEVILNEKSEIHDELEQKNRKISELLLKRAKVKQTVKVEKEILKETNDTGVLKSEPTKEKPTDNSFTSLTFIVGYNFDKYCDFALEHAIIYALPKRVKIVVAASYKSQKERIEVNRRLQSVLKLLMKKYSLEFAAISREGDFYEVLIESSKKYNASLVFIGSGGGSEIDKMSACITPYIVVRDSPAYKTVTKVAFPVDDRTEMKKKLNLVRFLNKVFDINYELIYAEKNGNSAINEKFENNRKFIEAYLNQNGINYNVNSILGTNDPTEATLKWCSENKSDLIMILVENSFSFHGVSIGKAAHKKLKNPENIPVLCINPKNSSLGSAFGGGVLY